LQDATKLLLASGANVHASASDDMNALHFAAQKGYTEIAEMLLIAGGATMLLCVLASSINATGTYMQG
jgi:ankyrin repeat protein